MKKWETILPWAALIVSVLAISIPTILQTFATAKSHELELSRNHTDFHLRISDKVVESLAGDDLEVQQALLPLVKDIKDEYVRDVLLSALETSRSKSISEAATSAKEPDENSPDPSSESVGSTSGNSSSSAAPSQSSGRGIRGPRKSVQIFWCEGGTTNNEPKARRLHQTVRGLIGQKYGQYTLSGTQFKMLTLQKQSEPGYRLARPYFHMRADFDDRSEQIFGNGLLNELQVKGFPLQALQSGSGSRFSVSIFVCEGALQQQDSIPAT